MISDKRGDDHGYRCQFFLKVLFAFWQNGGSTSSLYEFLDFLSFDL